MNSSNLSVKLTSVLKVYQLHKTKPTLVENLFRKSQSSRFVALNNVDLEIYRGEKVGIVGSNGSGKTTILKIIAGIATPNSGKVKTWGKVVSLIDLSAGFHPELSGYENVFQNGMLLGMNKKEVAKKMDEILAFADIGNFIYAPMYTYSAGMQLRLGFSIAVAAEPDILILDEGVAVGDQDFQRKVKEKIEYFYKSKVTIIVVSHWLDYLRENCHRIIWMDKGEIKKDGKINLLSEYEKTSRDL